MAYAEGEAPIIPPEAMKVLAKMPLKGKGASVYSIISAQASGISDAVLRATAGAKLDTMKPAIGNYLNTLDVFCEAGTRAKTIPQLLAFKETIWNDLVNQGKWLIDTWKAGLGLQMGTAFMSLAETYYGYPQMLSAYQTEKIDAGIRPLLERYWNAKFVPNVPDTRTAFQMLMEGQISRTDFNMYAQMEGWSAEWQPKLYEILNREPNEYLAFSMYKRGLITKSLMELCFQIRGYDKFWWTALYNALHRRPSFRELLNLADYVPLPEIWVSEVLRSNGYTDTDILYLIPLLRMRPLREEIRSVVGRYLWEYQIGRLDRDTLKANLTKLGILPKELELNLLWADLRYADELLDEELAIIEARVQYGDPTLQTQDDIFEAIVTLGVLEEKANLMAELWYYKYVYVPP